MLCQSRAEGVYCMMRFNLQLLVQKLALLGFFGLDQLITRPIVFLSGKELRHFLSEIRGHLRSVWFRTTWFNHHR